MLNIAEPYCYSLSSQSTISSKEFLQKAGELVSDYDTPFFSLESSVEVDFEESNRLIIKTNSNDPLTDYRGAVDKTEGWNSIHILQYQSKEDAQEALEFYSNQNYVDYVEEDKYVDIVSESDSDGIVSETPLSWGNNAVKSFSTNNLLLESNIDLADITVGIFDTGLNTNHDCFSDDRNT